MSSAPNKSLPLGALLVILGIGALSYVGLLSVQVGQVLQPTAAALEASTRDLLSDQGRIATNLRRLREVRRHVAQLAAMEPVPAAAALHTSDSLRREIRVLLDSGATVRATIDRANVPLEMRLFLAAASEQESALAITLLESLRAVDVGRRADAAASLASSAIHADSATALLSSAQAVALTDLLRNQEGLLQSLQTVGRSTTVWVVLGMLLAVVAAWVVRRRFYVPIREMEHAVRRVTAGELTTEVPVRFGDELGRLGSHLNSMTAVLRERSAEEARARHNLTERFGRILDESANQIFVFDAESLALVQANRGARLALGYTVDDLDGLSLPEIFAADPAERLAQTLQGLRDGQPPRLLLTTWLRRRDGSLHAAEVTLQYVTDGQTGLYIAVAEDAGIRQQVRVFDDRLREFLLHHQNAVAAGELAEALPPLAVMIAEALSLSHCSIWQGSGNAREVLGCYDADGVRNPVAPREPSVSPFDGTLHLPLRLGTREAGVLVAVPANPAHAWSAEERNFLTAAADIAQRAIEAAERRRLEQALERAQRMDSIGQLAGGVAHDFNNILTAILGNLESARADLVPDAPATQALEEARQAALRAANLTRQLLTFARHQVVEVRAIDVAAGIRNTEAMLRRLIGAPCELRVEVDDDLGFVRLGLGQLDQLLMNLVVNARDAMPDGGTITISARRVVLAVEDLADCPGLSLGPHVELQVRDTGVGMDAKTRERVFEPFFTTKQLGRGTGLGLAVCYGIVQNGGGHIAVESSLGQGTTFRMRLPVTQPPGRSTPVPPQATGAGAEVILLAEDELAIRALLGRMLTAQGYVVLTAEDGQAAWELLEGHPGPLDLLITDIAMPRLGGRELAERVRGRFPEVPVLLMSGYTAYQNPQAGILADARFLAKPFTTDVLLRLVRECLDGAHSGSPPQ